MADDERTIEATVPLAVEREAWELAIAEGEPERIEAYVWEVAEGIDLQLSEEPSDDEILRCRT